MQSVADHRAAERPDRRWCCESRKQRTEEELAVERGVEAEESRGQGQRPAGPQSVGGEPGLSQGGAPLLLGALRTSRLRKVGRRC